MGYKESDGVGHPQVNQNRPMGFIPIPKKIPWGEVIKKTLERQNEIFEAWSFSLLRVFVEKGVFSQADGKKLEQYSSEMLSKLKNMEVE